MLLLTNNVHGCWESTHCFLTHLPLDKMATSLADNIFKCIFLNENYKIPIQISLKFVPRSPIDHKPAFVQVMAWRRTGDKPLPELVMRSSSLMHICGTRGRWLNCRVSVLIEIILHAPMTQFTQVQLGHKAEKVMGRSLLINITVTSHECLSNHWQLDSWYNSSSGWLLKKLQSTLSQTFCEGNPPVTGGFPSQMASVVESVPML